MNENNQPPVPPGIRAALLDKLPPQGRSRVLNDGACLPVHANDLRMEATANEVVLTFALTTGGGGTEPQSTQEVSRLALSYEMLESLVNTSTYLLKQALPIRAKGALDTAQRLQRMVEAQTPQA